MTTTTRTLEQALVCAETWRDSSESRGEKYFELLYDDSLQLVNDLVLLANEVKRLQAENARLQV
jgi:hypothetical protein